MSLSFALFKLPAGHHPRDVLLTTMNIKKVLLFHLTHLFGTDAFHFYPIHPRVQDNFNLLQLEKRSNKCSGVYVSKRRHHVDAAHPTTKLLSNIGIGSEHDMGQRDMKSLLEWSESRGIEFSDGLVLAPSRGGDWGMSLHKSAKAGTILLRVPKFLVLSSKESPVFDTGCTRDMIKSRSMGDHWPEFLLMVQVLVEKSKGSDSAWFPWLQSLPPTFTTGLFMDELERSHLPPLAKGLAKLQDKQFEVFSEAIRAIPDNNLQQFLSKCDSDELLQWAFSIVFTRSHRYSTHGEISADVVPVADIFNHRNPGDILWNDTPDYVEFVLKAGMYTS